jgi:hypothetical protein
MYDKHTTLVPEFPDERGADETEPPPFLTSWARVYRTVLAYLALLILLLYAITRHFSY